MSAPMAKFFHRLGQEPTSYFVALAVLLLLLSALFNSSDDTTLVIDRRTIDGRILIMEMRSGRSLSQEQRQQIEDQYIGEQILVREARLLGLENDNRIYDILIQKVRHVLSGDVIQPSLADLRKYYQSNQQRYVSPPTVTLDEIVIRSKDSLPQTVLKLFTDGAPAEDIIGDQDGIQSLLPKIDSTDLINIFDPVIAEAVMQAQVGQWLGPHLSARGQHWLRIKERFETFTPDLESIHSRVRLDWVRDEEENRFQDYLLELREKTTIEFIGETTSE